ncbi:MAG: alpha-2-macroglobulin family protein, partial [Planctomycetota bacterium]
LVTVADSQGRQLSQKTLALSAFGTFNAELTLDVQAPVGAYTITAAAKDKPEKSYSSQFLVQQFKTEKMRLTLETDRAVYFRGESVKLSIAADYYWGQPVAGKSVRYSLPDGRQLTATTDAAGKIAVTFDTTGLQPGAPLRFAAELEGENVRAAHVAVLARLGLALAVKPARDLVLSEESVDVEVAATMPDGKPAGDQAVKLFVLQRQAAAPDPVFAGLPWLARPAPQAAEATVEEHALTTDKETGKAVVKLSLKKGGQYVLRATAEDRFKQVVTGESALAVSDDEDATKLRFFADSDTLQVGGKAVLKLHSRVEAKLALLTFEGETILSHKVVAIKKDYNSIDVTVGHEHFPNFQIAVAVMDGRALRTAAKPFTVQRQLNVKVRPLQEAYAPGAAGKAELTVTDQLGKPVKGELSLAVVDEAVFAAFPDGTPKILDFFQAGAKRQAEFRLASTCGFAYAAPTRKVLQAYKDEKERLAQREDEAAKLAELTKDQSVSGSFAGPVLAPAMPVVAAGRINASAKAARRPAAHTANGPAAGEPDDLVLEDMMADNGEGMADKKVRIAGGKGGGPGEIAAPARREMPGAGLWLPAVVTDADGKAVVELPMPETTTRWRLTARGCTVETLVGEAAGGVVTRKDFFVAVKAPASWQEGDKVRLLARIHNMTKYAGPVEVTLTIWGGEGFKNRLVEKADSVKIDAGGTAELLLPEVDVPLAASLKVEVSARAGKAADAVAIEVPIRPWGLEFAADAGGVSKDSAVVEVQLPAGRKYGSTWMAVSIGADLQRTVLDLAAGGGYPVPLARGCVILPPPEEAAHPGSELLAAAAGLRYAKALKAPAPDIQRLADRAGGLIATLVVSQQADGGWCWRGRAGADWAVTATCFWALVEARGEGVPVNAQTIASAREYLRNTFTRLGTGENDPKAAILHALSTDNAADFAHANRLHRERNALSGPALAYTAMACVNLKRPELAKELLDVLEQKGHKAPDAANGLQWDGAAAYSYLNDDIETTALAALAMMKARPGSPKIKDAVDFLLARRGCGGFSPAKARGPAVSAIAEYFRAGADAQADHRLAVLVNGKELKTIEALGGQETLLLAVPGESIVEGKNRVEFRLTGRGQFAYAVTLRGFSTDMTEPGGWNYPRAQLRTYRHANLEYRGRPIPAGSSSPVSNVEVGQHVKVNVNMEPWGGENAYVAVEEPLPAGMVLVEGSLQGRFIHHDVRDGRIMMYFPPGGSIGNYAYELVGYSTGQYRVGPTVIRDLLHPGRMRVAGATALAVLRPGEKSDDKYEMNREERFALGQLYFNDGLYKEALTHLEPLLDRKQPYNEREVARMLLWIYTAEGFYDARRIVDVFEVLRERYADLEIPFEKILTIGKAYHDIGEFERAYLVFRATIDASFVKDANVSAVLEEEGQFLGSLDYQEDLWREYPDTAEVAQAYFALSQVLYQKAPEAAQLAKQAIRNAKAKGRAAPGRLPNRVDMLKEAIGLLKEFMTLYPTNPLADDAAFSMANAYLDLKQYEAVVELCTGFTTLFPKSEFEGGFQYMAALGHFWQGRSEQALAAAKVVAEGQSKDRDFARYIVAQIYHAEGKPAEAIDWYRKVAEQYPDAKGAVDYFEAKTIALEEVSVVKPGDAAKLTIKYRNVKEASYQIYRVDLMKLYLREKNLSTITKVNLAGIAPLAEATLTLGDGKDYADKEKTVELKVKDEGAYLVICRGDDLFASGLVLITPLKIDIQEDALSGRVRVNVTDPAAKRYVPEVHVKAVGSADGVFRGGETDLRGIFVANNIRGKVTVIARSGDSRYAFHRGQAWLGAPEEAPVPAPAAERQGDTDYNMNLRSQNDAVQRANTIQYQKVRQGKPTGVKLEKLW